MDSDEKAAPFCGSVLKFPDKSENVESNVQRYSTAVDGVDASEYAYHQRCKPTISVFPSSLTQIQESVQRRDSQYDSHRVGTLSHSPVEVVVVAVVTVVVVDSVVVDVVIRIVVVEVLEDVVVVEVVITAVVDVVVGFIVEEIDKVVVDAVVDRLVVEGVVGRMGIKSLPS